MGISTTHYGINTLTIIIFETLDHGISDIDAYANANVVTKTHIYDPTINTHFLTYYLVQFICKIT